MPPIDTNAPGHFCWMELMTPDRVKAKAFYGELAGWESSDMEIPMPDEAGGNMIYTQAGLPGAAYKVAGMMQMDGPMFKDVLPHWMPYISVVDVDATAARAVELGGEIAVPPTDIPDVGRFTLLKDPTGAMVSFITLKPM